MDTTTAAIVTALDQDINGSSGNDVQTGGSGNDRIFGGAGNDTMDGGAGSDFLNGGSGADTLIYTVAQNVGATDIYMGGSGKDTLILKLTAAEWVLYQSAIAQHLAHIAAVTNAQTGEVSNGQASDYIYRFGSATLTVQMMEKLQVYVDGIKFVDSTDKTPTSTNDTAVVIEDTAKILGVGDFGTFSDSDPGDSLKAVQITVLPVNGSLTLAGVAVTAGQVISAADIVANKLVYTPAANDDTNEALTFKVMDQADVVSVAYTLTLAITAVNDASVVTAGGTLAYTENQAATAISTGLTITDVDSAQLTGAVVSITGNFKSGQDVLGFISQNGISGSYNATTGVLTLSGNASLADYQTALRSVTYSNSSENPDTAARTVSFQVNDGGSVNNLSNVATSSVTVAAVNDAPTTTAVTLAAIAEDSGVRVITQAQLLANATDVEGNALVASNLAITTGSGSLVDNHNGTWSYTPALNDDTSVAFSYTITDNGTTNGASDPKSVAGSATLDITPVNDAPTTTPVTLAAIAEDSGVRVITQAQLLANANDVEGNSLVASNLAITTGSGSLVDNHDGTWSYTPALNDDTSVAFSYTITDNGTTNGAADPKSVAGSATLDITPVNDAPTTTAVTLAAIAEDSGVRVITQAQLLSSASDVEGDSLTASNLAITTGSGSLVDNHDGTWSYTPALNDDTSVAFSYTITDNGTTNGASDPKSVAGSATLDITPVNDAPTTTPVTLAAIAEDSGVRVITQAQLLANASDVEGDSLVASALAISTGSGSLVDNHDGTWSYTPALNDDTSVAFSYTITDNGTTNGAADPKSVAGSATLDITPVNDAPTTTPVTLAAIAEDSGVRVITQAQLLANASDVEGDTLVASNLAITTGSGSLVDNHDGTWNYTPALNDDTSVAFSYTITDNGTTNGAADPKSVAGSATLDITPVNDAPTTTPVTLAAIAEDSGVRVITQAQLLANATDVEGNALVASNLAITTGSGSLVDNHNGTWSYTPALNDDTSVAFSYTITDNGTTNGAADPKSVAGSATLDITPVNDAPTTTPVTLAAIAEDSGVRVITQAQLLANASDLEGNSLAASNLAITGGGLGSLVDNHDGTWSYTPALNDDTSVAFSYTITDNGTTNGAADPKSVAGSATLDITPVNDAPDIQVVTTDTAAATLTETNAGLTATGTLTVTDADLPDTVASSVTGVTLSGTTGTLTQAAVQGFLTVSPTSGLAANPGDTHNLTWNFSSGTQAFDYLNVGQSLTLAYTVQSSDGNGGSDTQQVSITINGTDDNQNPVSVNDRVIVSTNTLVTIAGSALLANDTDIDGAALAITGVGSPTGITGLVLNSDGTISFTSGGTVGATAGSFQYTVSDGAGGTTTGSVTIDVRAVGAGADTINLAATGSYQASYLNGGAGADIFTGGVAGDQFIGGDGADILTGSDGNDLLIGNDNNDTLSGGAGNDILRGGMGNNDSMDGGAGTEDMLDFSDGTVGIVFTLTQSAIPTSIANGTGGLGNNDTYVNIEGVIGTGLADTITGSSGNDIIRGGGGNDSLDGAGGIDLIDFSDATGGISFTLIQGSTTTTFAAPGLGTDSYKNFEGVIGTNFADTLTGTALADTLRGGGGNDVISGLGGNDRIHGGAGADTLSGGTGAASQDTFVFDTAPNAVDTITDFEADLGDKIELSKAVFTGLATPSGSTLAAAEFAALSGTGASDTVAASVHVIYDSASNNLYYDVDGGSSANRTLVVTLTGVTGVFDQNDIVVGI